MASAEVELPVQKVTCQINAAVKSVGFWRVHMSKVLFIALLASGTLVAASACAQSSSSLPSPSQQESTPPPDLPTTRSGAVEHLAKDLEADYVLPDIGRRYAAMLRANLARGDYDKPADTAALAKQMTDDLQAVHPDKHVRVTVEGQELMGPPPAQGAPAGGPPPLKGVEETKWIAPGVAYIRFSLFSGSPEELAAVKAFMEQSVTAKAIIIDARGHHGGGLDEMNVMLPYLYEKKTVLVDMDVSKTVADQMGAPPDTPNLYTIEGPPGVVRREHVVIPNPTENRLFNTKVFYLTSSHTGSAAEHLALALKRTHRAVLVGEHTAGANHFGGIEPIGAGLEAFIPIGRTFDPDTGQDWEGTGVLPDISVPADQALDVALKMAAQ
jgi:hypothetical protein